MKMDALIIISLLVGKTEGKGMEKERRDNVMNNRLVLLGGGGHCKSVIDSLNDSGIHYGEVALVDPYLQKGSKVMGVTVAGGDEKLEELLESGYGNAFVSTGSITDTSIRHRLYNRITEIGFRLVTIQDGTAVISDRAEISEGVFCGKSCVINAGSCIEDMVIINTGAIVEHDCHIGAFSHISVGAILCGDVTVGKDAFVGAGTTVIQGITIRDGAIIGANSTVLRDIKENERVVGVVR